MARRLLITYLTITALALAVIVIPLGTIFARREHDRLVFDIERDAQTVASLVEDDLESGRIPSIDGTLSAYAADGGRIVVVDQSGLSAADSDRIGEAPRDFSTRPEIAAALDGERTSGTRESETLENTLVYVAVPVASSGVVHGAVRITYPTSTLDRRVRSTWLRLGALSVVVLGIVAAVGMVLSRSVTRPAERLQLAARRLAEGDLSARVRVDDGPAELRALASTFNTTAERLDHLIASQHRFVADASHELRTPLTALRLRLETLAPYVPEAAEPKLDAALTETNRLARLVDSLLVLARADAAATPTLVAGDLSAIVADRVEPWSLVGAEDGIDVTAQCPPAAWVRAVPSAIEQILDNLISNALEVAPAGTAVQVRVVPGTGGGGRFTELHVIDRGPGMTTEARDRAFERFWRPPGAASGGFGLGLAIVHQLATASQGGARLDAGPDGVGLDAVVWLPADGER